MARLRLSRSVLSVWSCASRPRNAAERPEVTREADAVLVDRAAGVPMKRSWTLMPARSIRGRSWLTVFQPPFMLDEFEECEEACRKDPQVIAALAKRGMTNIDLVCFEPWSVG